MIGSTNGKVASWNGTSWTNYNAGSGLCNNGTAIGIGAIYAMVVIANYMIMGGYGGKIVNWDGLQWNTTGNYTQAGGIAVYPTLDGMVVYGNKLGVFYYSAITMNQYLTNIIDINGNYGVYYIDGNIFTTGFYRTNIAKFITSNSYLYCYRYENGLYFINIVNNNLCQASILNNTTNALTMVRCSFALLQISGGYSRHIITAIDNTANHIYDGTSIKAAGLLGYTDFITFIGSVIYPSNYIIVGNGLVKTSKASYGYSDFTYQNNTSATDIFNYVSQFIPTVNSLYQILQGNTNTLIDAYGKLTNNYLLPATRPFEMRVGMIQGQSAYLSAALLDNIQSDTLGVLITNVGDFDESYQPQIKTDDTILYKYNGMFVIKKISKNITTRMSSITPTLFKINTLSPLNILDTQSDSLSVGSCDYNGRISFSSTVAPGISQKVASLYQGPYSNSIDTGDKVVTINPITTASVQVIGARIPVVATGTNNYSVDTYINDIYSFSTLNDGSELVKPENADLIYVSSTIVPLAIGSNYNNGLSNGPNNTVFLKPNYDGTSIGNDIAGIFTGFKLFGQNYLFDTRNFYTADIDAINGIFISKMFLCPATGLKYIASTPTRIYFLSKFDNSIFIFDGGRSLNKFQRMNSMETINSGIFSVTDNTLLLDTDNTFIWVRDEIISQNSKATDQTSLKYYNTDNGLVIGNNNSNWTYTYNNVSGASVVPLKIKTGYYGFNLNVKSILSAWVITIYNEAKTAISVKGTSYVIDEDIAREQITNWNINPVDYNDGGYVRIRLQPQYQRSLGTSLQIETSSKVFIIAILPEFATGETALVPNARSR